MYELNNQAAKINSTELTMRYRKLKSSKTQYFVAITALKKTRAGISYVAKCLELACMMHITY
jgi:hypothetical protein